MVTAAPSRRDYRLPERVPDPFHIDPIPTRSAHLRATHLGGLRACDGASWLPVALQEPVRRAFAAGRRIPQEVVGSEELAAEGVEG